MKKILTVLCLLIVIMPASLAADRELRRDSPTNTNLVIFVHGFTGDYKSTWGEFPNLIVNDNKLNHFDILMWGYPSRRLGPNPEIKQIGQHLKTELDVLPSRYQNIVLVAHSMGGLVVRASVVSALADGQREDLTKIKHIVLFGVPNEGIDKADYVPRFINNQISDMKTASDFVIELRNQWINRVYRASGNNDKYHLEIPTTTVAGIEDRFVPTASVYSFFPDYATTDGDHRSMVKPTDTKHLSFRLVRQKLLDLAPAAFIYDVDKFHSVLQEIEESITTRSEFLFPAIDRFLDEPTEKNWERVQREAKRNLNQLQDGIAKSLDYDSSSAVALRRLIGMAKMETETKFADVRREWNGKEHILIDITRPGNRPPVGQVREWNQQMRAHFKALKEELQRIYEEQAI